MLLTGVSGITQRVQAGCLLQDLSETLVVGAPVLVAGLVVAGDCFWKWRIIAIVQIHNPEKDYFLLYGISTIDWLLL